MNEKVELVTTRIYTQKDLIQLFGEGKKDVRLAVGFSRDNMPTTWRPVSTTESEVLKVEIREPHDKKTT